MFEWIYGNHIRLAYWLQRCRNGGSNMGVVVSLVTDILILVENKVY